MCLKRLGVCWLDDGLTPYSKCSLLLQDLHKNWLNTGVEEFARKGVGSCISRNYKTQALTLCEFLHAQASLVQSGPGAVFLGVGTAANLTYAGGKNATFVQGTGGLSGLEIANVQYTTIGKLLRFPR